MRLRHSLDSQLSKFTELSSPVRILCPATILKPSNRGNVRCDPGESKPSNRAYCQLSGASSPSRLVPSNNPTVRERSRSSVLNPCSLPRVRSGQLLQVLALLLGLQASLDLSLRNCPRAEVKSSSDVAGCPARQLKSSPSKEARPSNQTLDAGLLVKSSRKYRQFVCK